MQRQSTSIPSLSARFNPGMFPRSHVLTHYSLRYRGFCLLVRLH
ncbi:hypothetical protein RSAG8_12040, partial [Rhizoctonia solani AG-8 WAC10335]